MNKINEIIDKINIKLEALEIILTCPLWPKKENLDDFGKKLYDKWVEIAKPYCLLLTQDKYREALY